MAANTTEEVKYTAQIKSTDMGSELISDAKKIFGDLYKKSVNEKEMA